MSLFYKNHKGEKFYALVMVGSRGRIYFYGVGTIADLRKTLETSKLLIDTSDRSEYISPVGLIIPFTEYWLYKLRASWTISMDQLGNIYICSNGLSVDTARDTVKALFDNSQDIFYKLHNR